MSVQPSAELIPDRRRQLIIDAARDLFLEGGYAAVSMSAIAARVGGSKGTLYARFRSKEELFAAILAQECGSEFIAMGALDEAGELEEALQRLGERFLKFILSDRALALYRLIFAEAARFPELGRMFYEAGPERTLAQVARHLSAQVAQGRLRECDPRVAAEHLTALLKGGMQQRVMWTQEPRPGVEEVSAHVARAVQVFVRGYGV